MLEVEKWNELIKTVMDNPTDQATFVSTMTTARDEYATGYGELLAVRDENAKLKEENERYRQTNMDLFLRIGKEVEKPTGAKEEVEKDRSETITIEDVLKEALKDGN